MVGGRGVWGGGASQEWWISSGLDDKHVNIAIKQGEEMRAGYTEEGLGKGPNDHEQKINTTQKFVYNFINAIL